MNKVELSEPQVIHQLADRLVDLYPAVRPDQVVRVVQNKHARFEGRPVRTSFRCSWSDTPKQNSRSSAPRRPGRHES